MSEFCNACHYNMSLHKEGKCPPLPKIIQQSATERDPKEPISVTSDMVLEVIASERGPELFLTANDTQSANDTQVGGQHYRTKGKIQHWDFAASQKLDYFQGQITKYVCRWRDKNGIEDLKKAQHFLQKYIEVIEQETAR